MAEPDSFDVCVAGAGVTGLAIARHLALGPDRPSVLLLERNNDFGQEVSSRNSEVIHAGLYYGPRMLKARLCVRGRHLLYEYCRRRRVPYRRTGKYVVAQPGQEADLEALCDQALKNGVDDVQLVSGAGLRKAEPRVHGSAALLSPSSGIIDAHGLMTALLADAENAGVCFVPRTEVTGAVPGVSGGFHVSVLCEGEEPFSFHARVLVNAAGLGAQQLAASIEGLPDGVIPPLLPTRGSYFSLAGPAPFRHLIYPMPDGEGGSLGIHATVDLGGQVRFGPDAERVETIDYTVDPGRRAAFVEAIGRYYPDIREADLTPAYAGIRPKIPAEDGGRADFRIQTAREHGLPGLIQLFGIESPGLTASLSLAETVADEVAAGL